MAVAMFLRVNYVKSIVCARENVCRHASQTSMCSQL